jgi:Flp pilus assembly pilin Flp
LPINRSPASLLSSIWRDVSGQDLIEYALLAAMIASGVALTLSLLGASIQAQYSTIRTQVGSAGTGDHGNHAGGGNDGNGVGNAPR